MKNEVMNQAQIAQKVIFDYDSRSTSAQDYLELAKEFLEIWQKNNNLSVKRLSWQTST